MSVIYFLLLVGVLVLIHELGHYMAAKLLGIQVERLSVGYGAPLWRRRLGETEYQLGRFPLGGYVRILGVADDDQLGRREGKRSFGSRPLWQRVFVVLGGPLANLLLPVLIYFVLFAGQSTRPAAVIGDVVRGGPAERAGLQAGDRVLAIGGVSTRYWEDVERLIAAAPGRELALRLERNGKPFERFVTPTPTLVRERAGGQRHAGVIGISHAPFVPAIGVPNPTSPAATSGLRTGDVLVSLDGRPVQTWRAVEGRLGKNPRRASVVYFRGTPLPGVGQVALLTPGFADLVPATSFDDQLRRQTYTGIERGEMVVAYVDEASPAAEAGLRPGDLITALDDHTVNHWHELDQLLQAAPQKRFVVYWQRVREDGTVQTMSAGLTQALRRVDDAFGQPATLLVFGAHNRPARGIGARTTIDNRLTYALSRAVERTGETIATMVVGFGRVLGGDRPSDALGGALMMYRVASVSRSQGWVQYGLLMAIISVNLGLLNLLPVPMLDGGHILVFVVEAVRRRPLARRWRDRLFRLGLVVIVVITLLALSNDLMR